MTEARVRVLLVGTILVMSVVPSIGAFYLLDRAVQTSLDLGFNSRIEHGLDIGAESLKTLRRLDPAHQSAYRDDFEYIEGLRSIYAAPDWLRTRILEPLRIYVGLGLATLLLLSVLLAWLLSRRITEGYRAMLDELLTQRERVRYLQQMASWQDLARVLAHEIKNPLTPVEVMVSSLGRAHDEKTPEEFRRQLGETQVMVAEELAQLKRTVARFSEFARIPKAELLEENPVEVVRRHLPALRATFPGAGIDLLPGAAASVRARMDAALFRHVLMNIVGNGVEANPDKALRFVIVVAAQVRTVEIAISNDGETVSPSVAERLFEPYASERKTKENMGLGLAIVKKIIVEHGGSVGYLEQGGYPSFVITLPRCAA